MTGDVEFGVIDNTLVIKVPLNQDHGLSGSGKSNIVASSGGFIQISEAGVAFGLNVIKPKVRGK